MKLIVGLGNPGKRYENTRHNVGFMVIDALRKKLDFESFREDKNLKGEVSAGHYAGQKIMLLKPHTFMNLSAESVQKTLQFYKISPEECFVVYDDLDLPLGALRIRKEGGPGTHNGMKSLVQALGQGFCRLRVGIESRGVAAPERQETASFVLDSFLPEEQQELEKALMRAVHALMTVLETGIDQAMNVFNVSA